jgi:hypothetical protein
MHVVGDAFSCAPHTISSDDISSAVMNDVEIPWQIIHISCRTMYMVNFMVQFFRHYMVFYQRMTFQEDKLIGCFLCSPEMKGFSDIRTSYAFHDGAFQWNYLWQMIPALEVILDTQK